MRELQPLLTDDIVEGHDGEIFATTYLPDGSLITTVGWDGHVRLWDPASGKPLARFRAGAKPLSACTVSPDGKRFLTGSMEGVLALWDAVTQLPLESSVIHTRPISCLVFGPDGQTLASTGWDRTVQVRRLDTTSNLKVLNGHKDILTGCQFLPGGRELLSWSADGTVRCWDVASGKERYCLEAHSDRVTATALSPDGAFALTGSRDGSVKLWDLASRQQLVELSTGSEIRMLSFLLDGEHAALVDVFGGVALLSVPDLQVESEIVLGHKIVCGSLSPSGDQLALGGEEGYLHLVAIVGSSDSPIYVTPTRTEKPVEGLLARLFARNQTVEMYVLTCPRCRATLEFRTLPDQPVACHHCQQAIRVNARAVPVT